jgi:hypothetical protein
MDVGTVDGYWNQRNLPMRGNTDGLSAWTSVAELSALAAGTGESYDDLRVRRAQMRVIEMER